MAHNANASQMASPNSDLDSARPKFQVVKPWKNEIGSVAFHVISMNLVVMFGARPNAHND
jgi:hypothetical protein